MLHTNMEVFVTMDGFETDLDLGHYERFMDVELSKKSNITAGQIYTEVLIKKIWFLFSGTIQMFSMLQTRLSLKFLIS